MNIIKASIEHLTSVKMITCETIKEIYPHYYPKGAVKFFLSLHNDKNISADIQSGCVFLVLDGKQNAVGTITVKKNEICRLFVLPGYQKKGFGCKLLDLAESIISEHYETIILSASLPAKSVYLKRGYRESGFHSIYTENGDFLCYDVMQKNIGQ